MLSIKRKKTPNNNNPISKIIKEKMDLGRCFSHSWNYYHVRCNFLAPKAKNLRKSFGNIVDTCANSATYSCYKKQLMELQINRALKLQWRSLSKNMKKFVC
jgi:hypothetical protein